MMLIPMAHEANPELADELHGFYRFHSSLMEPWDGPAAIVASATAAASSPTLDRNGLRPGRWLVTDDGWVVLGSEAGVLPFDAGGSSGGGRLRPGHLFTSISRRGRVSDEYDAELEVARRRPVRRWARRGARSRSTTCPRSRRAPSASRSPSASSLSATPRRTCAS